MIIDLRIGTFSKFEGALQVSVGCAKPALAWPRQFIRTKSNVDRALLKLHCVASAVRG